MKPLIFSLWIDKLVLSFFTVIIGRDEIFTILANSEGNWCCFIFDRFLFVITFRDDPKILGGSYFWASTVFILLLSYNISCPSLCHYSSSLELLWDSRIVILYFLIYFSKVLSFFMFVGKNSLLLDRTLIFLWR